MQFCMAMAILKREVGEREFTDENALDAATQNLIRRVKMIPDPALNEAKKLLKAGASPVIVTVRLNNGKEYTQRVDYPKGHPDAPFSREEVLGKFRNCAEMVLSKEAAERTIDIIDNMEGVENLHTLASVLMAGK
jgi:2-methylcitrate dehydratase